MPGSISQPVATLGHPSKTKRSETVGLKKPTSNSARKQDETTRESSIESENSDSQPDRRADGRTSEIAPEQSYVIIAGERRWRAHQINKAEVIRARVLDGLTPTDIMILQIIENDQRTDVRPIDEARKFKQILDSGLSVAELATHLGRQVWRIEERVRLLDLDPAALKLYESGNLPQEAASEISRIKDHRQQIKLIKLVSSGKLTGYRAIRAAVDTILGEKTQADIFGDAAPKASNEDVQTLNRMERRIESVVSMISSGWKDGECVVATKVSPDRARLTADKIKAMRSALLHMENDLRGAAAQVEAVLA